jgi:hypothetical protein
LHIIIVLLCPHSVRASAPTGAQGLQVTEAVLKPERGEEAHVTCPFTVNFVGHITANGRGRVRYTFVRSDGATGPIETLDFEDAGTKSVRTTWTLGSSGSSRRTGWQAIKIVSPNEIESNTKDGSFVVDCQEPCTRQSADRRILEDGTIEIRYPDGTIKRDGPLGSGATVIHPDGTAEAGAGVEVQVPTPPPPPSGSTLSAWLAYQNARLLNAIKNLSSPDRREENINNLRNAERGKNLFEQIDLRMRMVARLMSN